MKEKIPMFADDIVFLLVVIITFLLAESMFGAQPRVIDGIKIPTNLVCSKFFSFGYGPASSRSTTDVNIKPCFAGDVVVAWYEYPTDSPRSHASILISEPVFKIGPIPQRMTLTAPEHTNAFTVRYAGPLSISVRPMGPPAEPNITLQVYRYSRGEKK